MYAIIYGCGKSFFEYAEDQESYDIVCIDI